jgi:hypothetical protein
MGGGGTAPKMKMSDALILTGITLLLGGLFMHAWVTPVSHGADDPPYTNGASMMKDDAFRIGVTVDNETTLRIVLKDDRGEILSAESFVLAAGEEHIEELKITTGGFYSYELDTKNTSATITVDIERKLMLDMLPFPFGALFLALGIYQLTSSNSEEEEEVLDAELQD